VLRYFRHLRLGRIDPRTIGFKLTVPEEGHDFAGLLRRAIIEDRIAETAMELAPAIAQYRGLREALTRYRSIAAEPGLVMIPPFVETVHPGKPYASLPNLHRLLVALGDLPVDTPVPRRGASYEEPLVSGVRRFQARHRLDADGILGRATHAALRLPLDWRVRQIELGLERLRWLPDLNGRRVLVLNIPMFHLWAWTSTRPGARPSLDMRAIVGRALSTETPVFVAEMRSVLFRPYWNVPPSIVREELLPLLKRDPDSLRRLDMEIVRGPGEHAQIMPATAGNIALLDQGVLRLRQRPGPGNALGLVKFDFPNEENVYLHGTPAQELFSRARRDFSHGCVRVENPVALAEWVLEDQPEWTRERILAAVSGSQSQEATLTRSILVMLLYTTAIVAPEDGTVRFAEDIYGHDATLDRALARAGSAP
jgi:murein L,D-transpeptidase YcbB/YkuD